VSRGITQRWFTGRWWDMSSSLGSKTHLGFPAAFNSGIVDLFLSTRVCTELKGKDRVWRSLGEPSTLRLERELMFAAVTGLNEISNWTCACLLFCLLLCLFATKGRRNAVSLAPARLFFYLNAYAPSGGNASS